MNLQNLIGHRKLDDEILDILMRNFCGLSKKTNVAYISSLMIDACLCKQRKNLFCGGKDQVLRNLGKSYNDKLKNKNENNESIVEGVIIVVHGPNCGNSIIDGVNINNHWSIMYYFKKFNRLYHYDSLNNFNGQKFGEIFSFLLTWDLVINNETSVCVPTFIPKQVSNWECGYYAIMYSYIITMRKDELTDIPFPISKTEAIEYNNNRLFEMHDPNSEIRKHILQFAIELAAIEKEKEMINNNSQLSPTTTTIIEERIRINKNVIEIN